MNLHGTRARSTHDTWVEKPFITHHVAQEYIPPRLQRNFLSPLVPSIFPDLHIPDILLLILSHLNTLLKLPTPLHISHAPPTSNIHTIPRHSRSPPRSMWTRPCIITHNRYPSWWEKPRCLDRDAEIPSFGSECGEWWDLGVCGVCTCLGSQ